MRRVAKLQTFPPVEAALKEKLLRDFFLTLYRAWGCQNWWPAASRFEVIVGTYLTQNTAWTNVERALTQLRAARLLTLGGIRDVPLRRLESLIRSSGYFRQKARRLKTFVEFVDRNYGGSLTRMFAQPTGRLRGELRDLNGVGDETADSILLYAGQHPVFVVDAYTRRILDRHGILPANARYDEIRELCERALSVSVSKSPFLPTDELRRAGGSCHPPSRMSLARRVPLVQVYNDMHGLIVGVGKHYCLKSSPHCEECPLRPFLPDSKAASPKVSDLLVL
jgi:endonuclease III related protein